MKGPIPAGAHDPLWLGLLTALLLAWMPAATLRADALAKLKADKLEAVRQAIQAELAGLVDDAHAAASQFAQDLVAGDGRVRRRDRHGRYSRAIRARASSGWLATLGKRFN